MSGAAIDPRSLGKVAVLMGGSSAERAISLLSGGGVLQALQSRGVDAQAFDPAERNLAELKAEGFARCFIALHGRHGEDGTVQGALELLGIPYTGSGVMASAISMDKVMTKRVWRAEGLPTPRWVRLAPDEQQRERVRTVPDELGLPLIVKPPREGSSIGVTKVHGYSEMQDAVQLAARYDPDVLCEEFIDGEEVTCPVPGEAREWRQRIEQRIDITALRRGIAHAREQPPGGLWQLGEQHAIEPVDQPGEAAGARDRIERARRGSRSDRLAPAPGLDQVHRELRPPDQLPVFVEGAAPARRAGARLAPGQVEQAQPVQQAGAFAIERLAQVEVEIAVRSRRGEAQALLFAGEIARERRGRHVIGHAPEPVADFEFAADQRERERLAGAQRRVRGLFEIGQIRPGASAQRRQRLGEAQRVDQLRGRCRQIVGAQQLRAARQPAQRRILAVLPQVFVPAGHADAGTVAAREPEPLVRPRHPGARDLHLRPAGEQRLVGLRRRQRCGEGRHVPGAADDGDAFVPFALRGADRLAHRRLARGLPRVIGMRIGVRAQRRHRLGDRGEQRQLRPGFAALDVVLPPRLAVVEAGEFGEGVEGVAPARACRRGFARRRCVVSRCCRRGLVRTGLIRCVLRLRLRHRHGERQIAETRRHAVFERPAQRLPFRRELRERVEHGTRRIVGDVCEQRDRRFERRIANAPDQAVGLGRPFDQQQRRRQRIERREHRARAAGAVVADAEQVDFGRHGRSAPPVQAGQPPLSRQAR